MTRSSERIESVGIIGEGRKRGGGRGAEKISISIKSIKHNKKENNKVNTHV